MTIKAIFFDLGGVILRTSDQTPRANLAAEFNMSYEEMDKFVFESKSAALASVGKLKESEHWLDVTRRLNCPEATMPHIRDAFFGGDTIDQEIINLLRSLRKTHKTGLISNGWDGLRPWIVKHNLENAFDTMVISAEMGIAKPDARIYEFALKKLDVQAGEAIFVDDVEKNILACQALGMNGVLFRNSPQALTEVKQLLNHFEDQPRP
jgi:epoxide hydrolase-like predicted phosphatase